MVTISALRIALNQPAAHFQNLQHLQWMDADIIRSTHFAQTRIRLGSKDFMLFMPLQNCAMHRIERFVTLHRELNCDIIPKIEILRNEMHYSLANGIEKSCDIVLESLPEALPLADAIASIDNQREAEKILTAIDALEDKLHTANVSHNHLHPNNILISDNGTLYPTGWYYATDKFGGDNVALDKLRTEIGAKAEFAAERTTVSSPHTSSPLLDQYNYVSTMHEGLIAVEDENGWGYIDLNGCEVIKPQYIWANDFCEGRAEVQTRKGMGLIDKCGNYIIEPQYEAVEFDVMAGWVRVCQNKKWALFDYSGRQLCDWDKNLCKEQTQQLINELQ